MSPHLTRTGLATAACSVVFMMAGVVTGSWSLTALGTVAIGVLMTAMMAFYPKATAVRRRKLELAWWVPGWKLTGGALTPKTPFPLQIFLRNRSPYSLGRARIRAVCSSAVNVEWPPPTLRLPAGSQVSTQAVVTANAAGHWFLHGAAVTLTDVLGFYKLEAYFPSPLELTVFPSLAIHAANLLERPFAGAPHERAGAHKLRIRGFGGELREIRDHRPGDPFKQIAWKPTARLRKLMVKEYESEILMTHYVLLDISSTMRDAKPGESKLDYAMEFAASFARTVLNNGDRVGLITFDSRVYGHLKPGDGRGHLYRIVDHLMELHHVADEDLTDVTDMELVEAVGDYMLFQEGLDARVPHIPDPTSSLWKKVLPGTRGQLYLKEVLHNWADNVCRLHAERSRVKTRVLPDLKSLDRKPEMATLRLASRLKGIELEHRPSLVPGNKDRGAAEALRLSAASLRSQFVFLVSDLQGMGAVGTVKQALELVRRRHHRLSVLCPFAPKFVEQSTDPRLQTLHRIFQREELTQIRPLLREMGRQGVPVYVGSPGQVTATLTGRLERFRRRRTGRAA